MSGIGGYVWFIGLGGGIVILALAMLYARLRKRAPVPADPNHAWRQEAAASGHPEVAGRERS